MSGKRELLFWVFSFFFILSFFLFRVPPQGLIASYYKNPEWKGLPAFSNSEAQPDFETLEYAIEDVGFPQENISISWNGWIKIDQDGVYHFSIRSDDGSSIMIDENLVVDNGGFHGIREVSGEAFLTKGMHRFNISYFNGPGSYALSVYWKDHQGNKTSIPSKILFPSRLARYLSFLPRHPVILYLMCPAIWLFLFFTSIGRKSILQNKRKFFMILLSIPLCYLFFNLRYVCDSSQKLETILLVSYCFFLFTPCFYLILKALFSEFIRTLIFTFYLFLALFPYRIFFPATTDLCVVYTDPSSKILFGLDRYWILILYGIISLFITSCWLWYHKKNPFGSTSKKELIICGTLLIITALQIIPRLDENSPRMMITGVHKDSCGDDSETCTRVFFGYCVMCDVLHHTVANGMFKGVYSEEINYKSLVNNRRGLNAYFYALTEPFLHPYYAAILVNGFFFYLILMTGYSFAKYFMLHDTIAFVYPILLSANFLLLSETVDTSFYIQKHAFPVLILVIGYRSRIYSEAISLTNKVLFCTLLACSALVYDPYINVAFVFLWGLFHTVSHLKIRRVRAYSTLLHAILYASIPIISQSGFETLLRYYHLEGNLDNENARNVIFHKLPLIPGFIIHHLEDFIVRINREIFRLLFENPVRNEYLAILGAIGIICFFSVLPKYVKSDDLKGMYAIYSASLIVPLIASLAAYIPPVTQYAPVYTAPDRTSNYYAVFILAQSVGIYHIIGLLYNNWLPPWVKSKYLTFFVVLFVFVFSYYKIIFK